MSRMRSPRKAWRIARVKGPGVDPLGEGVAAARMDVASAESRSTWSTRDAIAVEGQGVSVEWYVKLKHLPGATGKFAI